MSINYVPNVDISKAFNSTVMLINDKKNKENGLCLIQAGADGPAIHYHPNQEEKFHVIEGNLEVYKKDKWVKLTKGESLTIPKKTPHTFRSRDEKDCLFEYVVTPKGDFSGMLKTFESLMQQDKLTSTKDLKSLIYLSMTFRKHKKEIVSVTPPPFVISTLAKIGDILGYKF